MWWRARNATLALLEVPANEAVVIMAPYGHMNHLLWFLRQKSRFLAEYPPSCSILAILGQKRPKIGLYNSHSVRSIRTFPDLKLVYGIFGIYGHSVKVIGQTLCRFCLQRRCCKFWHFGFFFYSVARVITFCFNVSKIGPKLTFFLK